MTVYVVALLLLAIAVCAFRRALLPYFAFALLLYPPVFCAVALIGLALALTRPR